jgi:Na+/H+ antiporter NhaC
MNDYGILTLLPTAVVVALALYSHRTIESLLAGSVVGLFMLDASNPLGVLADKSLAVMMNETVAWIILVCGFMGSLIALFIRTDAIGAFTKLVSERINSRRQALMTTWVLGIFLFVDDYLNSLAVGAAMRKISDSYHTSREMLAYIVDSTAAPVSVLIPISTWAVFFGALMVDNGIAAEGQGVWTYIGAIPYMFYAWIAVIMVPLVIYDVVPALGPMRAAEARAQAGQPVPPEAKHIEADNEAIQPKEGVTGNAWQFILPMILLAGSTWYFDLDFLKGIYLTLAVYLVMIMLQRTLTIPESFDTILDGFKTMIQPLAVLVAAYLLKEINDELGLSTYVLDVIAPYITAKTLPVVLFISMAGLAFATGSNWGVFVIVLPVVTSLAHTLNADMTLVIGATLSASTFGSHACFYTDATVLTAQATGCTPYQHAYTQIPYALIAASISALAYWIIA